ncbi:MAG TPA: alpha/beta hydrolase [Dehalococcoidia bacterium]|jgi:pimeloyl-ACP methyl ester carboxylesterase|nr:alpha/beta hydrolase [Chloroflexota bacterium]HIB11158.1 alpha/beta hydrolase [Dehalococcoidia bacterium]HIM48300.1 alpha/beta hydrolase [Dehalococcoidia bacterium]|tara:strand:+ start:361 stop:1191 length:831 start_codon:yes stop_codon:yes gene_type:complete
MATFSANGVNLYYEETGEGFPLVWSHEFAGNYPSWDPQVRFFSRRYRVITYSARGYPPSDVPEDPDAYSQDLVVEDLYLLLRHLRIDEAYIGGLSMGGTVALNFAIAHPEMCRGIIVASVGSGSDDREAFLASAQVVADRLLSEGMAAVAHDYARGEARLQFLRKDPKGWQEFHDELAAHSALGSSLTFQGFQMKRPTVYALEESLRQLLVPTLIMIGDEDEPCVESAVFMKRRIPHAGLSVFPQSGHTINLEEPDLFNRTVLDFLTAVEAGRWGR